MPTNRNQIEAAVVDGKIYVMGGRTAGPYSTVNATEIYDPTTETGQTALSPALPQQLLTTKYT